MKTPVKITLLVVAIVAAVCGVLLVRHQLTNPPEIKNDNQYVAAIKEDIARVKKMTTDSSVDSLYVVVTQEIAFQEKNRQLTDGDGDKLLAEFLNKYVPHYVARCDSKFQQSVWHDAVLRKIQGHITELRGITSSEGKSLVAPSDRDELKRVSGVIDDYHSAWAAAKVGGFLGIEAAKKKIADADKYIGKDPLKNCDALQKQLKSVRKRLEEAHYDYLKEQVNKLAKYEQYRSVAAYDALESEVRKALNEYRDNAKDVYKNHRRDISSLRSTAGDYYEKAKTHFDDNGIH